MIANTDIKKNLPIIGKDWQEKVNKPEFVKDLLNKITFMHNACLRANANYMGKARNGFKCQSICEDLQARIKKLRSFSGQIYKKRLGDNYGKTVWKEISDSDLKSTALKMRANCIP